MQEDALACTCKKVAKSPNIHFFSEEKSVMKLLTIAVYCSAILSPFASYAAEKNAGKAVEVKITNKGFEPKSVTVGSDAPVTLKVTRETDQTCAKSITVPNALHLRGASRQSQV